MPWVDRRSSCVPRKSPDRPLRVYDVFGMIPPPGEEDGPDVHQRYEIIKSGKSEGIGGRRYYGYEDNLYERVVTSFHQLGFRLRNTKSRSSRD